MSTGTRMLLRSLARTPSTLVARCFRPTSHGAAVQATTSRNFSSSLTSNQQTDAFLTAIKSRRSVYTQDNSSPISDAEIEALVKETLHNTPSAFNIQSTRVLLLLNAPSSDLWTSAKPLLIESFGEKQGGRAAVFASAHGTALFFEDQDALDESKARNPALAGAFDEWAVQSNGMHQFVLWTALANKGFGCNLQHFHVAPKFVQLVQDKYDVPKSWRPLAQLTFGGNTAGVPEAKPKLPFEKTLKVFGQ